MLDVGGGNGVIGQVIHEMLDADVTSIDVEERFLPALTIKTAVYDGLHLPFSDASFDAITLFNMLHHVPKAYRSAILIECRRVCSGPLYIKDHLRLSRIDDLRLHLLDAIGNIPFGGMVKADYLSRGEWDLLLSRVGYSETSAPEAAYRGRLAAIAFPNRLEVFLKWTGT